MSEISEKEMAQIIYIANNIYKRLPNHIKGPDRLDLKDLIHEGCCGHLEAKKRFLKEAGIQLTTYTYFRVRGTILDYLRRSNGINKRANKKVIFIDIAEYYNSDPVYASYTYDWGRFLSKVVINNVFSRLKVSTRHRNILFLYYNNIMDMEDIGKKFGISESRISQICSDIVEKLKIQLKVVNNGRHNN